AIDVGHRAPRRVDLETGTLGQRLRKRAKLRLRACGYLGLSWRELYERQLLAPASCERAEQRERCRGRLRHQIDDDLHDDAPDRELRIVERTLDRKVEIDHAVAILEQRNRQQHWQLRRIRAVDVLAERELVEHQLVRCGELAILDLIVHFE